MLQLAPSPIHPFVFAEWGGARAVTVITAPSSYPAIGGACVLVLFHNSHQILRSEARAILDQVLPAVAVRRVHGLTAGKSPCSNKCFGAFPQQPPDPAQ